MTQTDNIIDGAEMLRIGADLESHDSVFYKFWSLGRPSYSTTVKTAGVSFDHDGQYMNFLLNAEFWNGLSFERKKFVICHECLHIILNHGSRFIGLEQEFANYAADIVINHALINRFGFIREEVDPENRYCWIDKFFDNTISDDMNFEYYYDLLANNKNTKPKSGDSGEGGDSDEGNDPSGGYGASTVDEHSFPINADEILDALGKNMSDEEKNSIKEFVENNTPDSEDDFGKKAGTSAGNTWLDVSGVKVVKKKKWETVIKKWASKYLKEADKDIEQWARLNRRLAMLPSNMFLPSDMEIEDIEKEEKKIDVWFFQDTSGSCMGFAKRFFAAAQSLPTSRFNMRLFCFDTEVYETTLATKKLYGFGGTSYSCIELQIQKIMNKEKVKYPSAVFVITDGEGNTVKPQYPKKWYWFLSKNYTHYIPKESKRYMLKDFE